MATIGFGRIVRTLLRKKVEKLLNSEIEVHSRNTKSHYIVYRLPYEYTNLMVIHPTGINDTAEIYLNEEFIEEEHKNIIINEFSKLLEKHGFDLLINCLYKEQEQFIGTSEYSNAVMELIRELGPLRISSSKIYLKESHHPYNILPVVENKLLRIYNGYNHDKSMHTVTQTREWISQIKGIDSFINESMEQIKQEYSDLDFQLRVDVVGSHSYRARLDDKYVRSDKSIEHLFGLIRKRLDKIAG
jgi:hypothetical protein